MTNDILPPNDVLSVVISLPEVQAGTRNIDTLGCSHDYAP